MPIPIVKKIKFDPNGGPLKISLVFDTMLLCTYELDLRPTGSESSVPTFPKSGDNVDAKDDTYDLPAPPKSNDGRSAWVIINILDETGKGGTYQCFGRITQAGEEIGVVQTDKKPISGNSAQEILVAQFVANGE